MGLRMGATVCPAILIFALIVASIVPISTAVNDFGFNLMRELRKEMPTENLVFSPFSISSTFSLLYFGTKGATRTEIEAAFGFQCRRGNNLIPVCTNQNGDIPRALLQTARRSGENPDAGGPIVDVANRAYIDNGFTVLDSYKAAVGGDSFRVVDFANEVASRNEINEFVEMLTRGLIKDLIPMGAITADVQAMLVNAIYFKAKWAKPFKKENTAKSEFRGPRGTSKTDFMSTGFEIFPFKHVPQLDARILQLPYEGGRFSMFILLPNTDDGFSKAESDLRSSLDLFQDLTETFFVSVKIPKWEIEQSMDMLKTHLMDLGVRILFTPEQADLSGLSDAGSLVVSDVVHKAKIIVDEEGTEAPAATTITLSRSSSGPPPPEFVADHPFLFFVVDTQSGDICFQGTVTTF
ncbi:hypothetical protein BSKO_02794 [Bryopsis sp. KO-2023]|nr:hypothetical protein BSKO_02794 [Bryopsis sp. KO-2023]